MTWKTVKLGNILTESKIPSTENNPDRRISVRLNKQGVEKRALKEERTGATKYYIRKARQFIYGQQNLHKGAFGIIPEELDGFESSNDLPAFDISNVCMPEWLIYFFSQNGFYKTLGGLATGIGSKRIYPKQIFDIEIPLPPLGEQYKIIERINNLEIDLHKLNDINEKNEKLVKQLKSSILQDAIQGKLVPQDLSDEPASILIEKIQAEKVKLIAEGKLKKQKPLAPIKPEEIPYELPNGWEWVRLEELCEIITKGSSPTWQGVSYSTSGVLFITSENVGIKEVNLKNKKYVELKFNEIEPKSVLKYGDILMNIVGASIGRTAMFKLNELANINQAVCIIRLINILEKEYFLNFFNSSLCLSYMLSKQVNNARENLSMGNIAKFLIPLPPLQEQKRIIEKIDELMKSCELLDEQIRQAKDRSEKLMESVLQGVFNG